MPAQTNGPLRVHPDNPRYFADRSGWAILLTGSHTWPNLVDMGPNDPPPAFEFDNPLYEVSNETLPSSTAWQYQVIRYVKQIESSLLKQHPIAMTYQNRRGKNRPLLESPAD